MVEWGPEPQWPDIVMPIALSAVTHPIEYAKFLIQIGYEPIPPRQTVTFFGRPVLALPNIFKYVRHIKTVKGFTGCYNGIIPKLCANSISVMAMAKTRKCVSFGENDESKNLRHLEEEENAEESLTECIQEVMRELASRIVGIVASHPLEVIAVRMMAQFVGGENKYNGLFRSFVEVYKENGITGYYAGLIPRIFGNTIAIILAGSCNFLLHKYVITESDMRKASDSLVTYLVSAITYPFNLVSRCMQVNDCGLVAGIPPQMPIYSGWQDCWCHLRSINQLNRGSNVLWRYYTGPQTIINGKLVPVYNKYNIYMKPID